MKHLKLFSTDADYQSFVSNVKTPNVSFVEKDNLIYFHPFSNTFNLEFNPTVFSTLEYYGCPNGSWTQLRYYNNLVNYEISDCISDAYEDGTSLFEVIKNNITNEHTVTNPLMGYCDVRYVDVEFDDSYYIDTVSSYKVKLPFFVWYEGNNLKLVLYKYQYNLVIDEEDGYIVGDATYTNESDEVYVNCVTGPIPPDGSLEPTPWLRYPILTVPPITPEANYVINFTLSEEEIALVKEQPYNQFDEEEFYQQIETYGLIEALNYFDARFDHNFVTEPFDNVLPGNLVNQMVVNGQVEINVTCNLTITKNGNVVKTFTDTRDILFKIELDTNSTATPYGSYRLVSYTPNIYVWYNPSTGELRDKRWSFGIWC